MNGWHTLIGQIPFEWAQYAFMRNALLAILLVSPIFALLGCQVIHNQMAFFSEAVGHSALTGVAIGVLLGLGNPLPAMLVFSLLLAAAVTLLRQNSRVPMDTVIGLVMASVVATGVVLLSRGGGFAKYSRYLIGDLLTITPAEIFWLAAILVVVTGLWLAFYNPLFLANLNPSLAKSRGIRVRTMEMAFAMVTAFVVTASIPWMGLLVVNSLLILPAAASRNLTSNTPRYVWSAIAISLVAGVAGLIASFYFATATGATIVLFAFAVFVLSMFRRR